MGPFDWPFDYADTDKQEDAEDWNVAGDGPMGYGHCDAPNDDTPDEDWYWHADSGDIFDDLY